jgi:CO/xanthine dehydrogenase FAD-binding subunit
MVDVMPVPLKDALQVLNQDVRILAGGTDFYPALDDCHAPTQVLDLARVSGLNAIDKTESGWRIGATVTWTDIIGAALPPAFDALKCAAREVGSVQIQNAATIGGNLCNASPAADGVPPLLCLNAEVELASVNGVRKLPLSSFIKGPRSTARRNDELLIAIHIPPVSEAACSEFFKLGARRYLVISIAMVSVLLAQDDKGCLSTARIAVGSCSAVAQRLSALESVLIGQSVRSDLISLVTPAMLEPLKPIADIRATAENREEVAHELVRRLLSRCLRKLADFAQVPDVIAKQG